MTEFCDPANCRLAFEATVYKSRTWTSAEVFEMSASPNPVNHEALELIAHSTQGQHELAERPLPIYSPWGSQFMLANRFRSDRGQTVTAAAPGRPVLGLAGWV